MGNLFYWFIGPVGVQTRLGLDRRHKSHFILLRGGKGEIIPNATYLAMVGSIRPGKIIPNEAGALPFGIA